MSAKIRGFLLQKPKPSRVRVTGDGEPQEISVGRSYSRLAETIEALDVDLVECLDPKGNVLRALRLSSTEATRSDAAPLPDVLKGDPNAAMLSLFADLIHRAYAHSCEVAFTKMVDVTERLSNHTESIEARLAAAESQLRRTNAELVNAELDRLEELKAKVAEGEGGGLGEQMISSFLGARMNGAGAGHAKNGAG